MAEPSPEVRRLAARWRALVRRREAQVVRVAGAATSGPGHWDQRAAAFDACSRAHDLEHDPLYRLLLSVVPGRRLLDIGAGAGRYAVPLAATASAVTAVEPSSGMRARLSARLDEERRDNVRIVAGAWPDAAAAAGHHDVALVSHAIYGAADLVGFLDALEAAAPLRVVAIRVEPMGYPVAGLFARLHGEPPVPDPTLATLVPVLLARGALPTVQYGTFGGGSPFATLADVQAWAAEQLRLAADDPRRGGLAEPIRALVAESPTGWHWRVPLHTGIVAWGEVDGSPSHLTP